MINACIWLLKKYPYALMGCLGIGLMITPVFVGNNLKLLGSVDPFANRIISPLMASTAFQMAFGSLPFLGLILSIIAIVMNDRSDPPPKS